MEIATFGPVLIADPDLEYAGTLRLDPKAREFPPVIATNEDDAIKKLLDPLGGYSAIFLNPEIHKPYGMPVIRAALKHFPATPIYFLTPEFSPALDPQDLQYLTIRKVIQKPVSYSTLLKTAHSAKDHLDVESILKHSADNRDAVGSESLAAAQEFAQIRARQYISGSSSLFDLYVKLGESRFLKILQSGDRFDPERVGEYLKKGVEFFYVRKEAQENYLKYCDHLTELLIRKQGVPQEVKINSLLNLGEETLNFLRNSGVGDAGLAYAKSYAESAKAFVERLAVNRNESLRLLMTNMKMYDCGVGTTLIASLLVREMRFTSEKSAHTVGLACLLQDIGCLKLPPGLCDKDESEMTEAELALYHQHPELGVKALEGIRNVDPSVIQGIQQHHERRDRTGFPSRLPGSRINKIAEIVGISDEYARLLKKAPPNSQPWLASQLESRVFPGFSAPVVDAFRRVFLTQGAV